MHFELKINKLEKINDLKLFQVLGSRRYSAIIQHIIIIYRIPLLFEEKNNSDFPYSITHFSTLYVHILYSV